MNSDLKIIKKKYGEKMMHFCREFFPTLLEKEGLLSSLLLNNFNASHNLYNDLVEYNLLGDFKEYIYSLVDVEHLEEKSENIASPEELLASVGYDLYECHTEEEIQSFRKYYAPEEVLCTFTYGNRLDTCRVFFAIKKNVEEIKREDFKHPKRQDEYGTSVISIQFEKLGGNRLSIKNRYNHHVNNPDSTFSNNLDNIVPGLTKSFEKYYGIKQSNVNKGFEIPSYTTASDGKYYKYNYEIDNVYYCPDNIIIINGMAGKLPKEKCLLFDYFVIDFGTKKITSLTNDGFIDSIGTIEKIEVLNCDLLKKVLLYQEDGSLITIILDRENNIIGLDNPYVKEVADDFLYYNKKCQNIRLKNVTFIGNYFMYNNESIKEIYFENVTQIGECFLNKNQICQQVILPKVIIISHSFMDKNNNCNFIYMPNLEILDNYFMYSNKKEINVILPKLEEIPSYFLINSLIKTLIISEVMEIKHISILKNLRYLYAPNLIVDNYKHFKSIFENIPYCYTPLMPECCNTTDFLKDKEIVDSIKLGLSKR